MAGGARGARASLRVPQWQGVQPPLVPSHPGDSRNPGDSLAPLSRTGEGTGGEVNRWIGLLVVALLAVALGTAVGAFPVSLPDVGAALAGRGDPATISIVRDLRLPRALLA